VRRSIIAAPCVRCDRGCMRYFRSCDCRALHYRLEAKRGNNMSHQPPVFRDPDDPSGEPDESGTDEQKPTEAQLNELESRLLKGRKVMVFGQVPDKLARDVVARILALVDESNKPVHIYVNSPGGHVESGDSIHDIIKFVRSSVPILMIGTGWVASA